jgi:hypothetical protein
MLNIKTVITEEIPKDVVILDALELSVNDSGIELYVKSSLLEGWAKKVSHGKTFDISAEEDRGIVGKFYTMPVNVCNHFNFRVGFEPGGTSIFWVAAVGLGEGIRIKIRSPLYAPGDLVEYVHGCASVVKKLYLDLIRSTKLSMSMQETDL